MSLPINAPFEPSGAFPIDAKFNMSKAEMLTVNDNIMPDKYFTICTDDGRLYLYDKSNAVDPETGKYRLYGGGGYDDTELRNRIAIVETQKATGYFERTDFDIPLSTAGQPAFALAKDSFKIEVENHKPYIYEFTAGDVYNLSQYSETLGKIFIARNEDNETIHVKMTGPLPDNVQYAPVSSNPVLDFTNATATLTKTTFLKQIDEMLIPATSGEVFIFDVDGDNLTEDPDNPGGKHYGITLTSPTFEEIMDNLVANKLVFARILYNSGNSSEIYQLFRTSQSSIRGKAFDLEFPQGYIWFYDIYIQKRNYETTTYFGIFADKVSDGGGTVDTYTKSETNTLLAGKSSFDIASISTAGGGDEVHATLTQGEESASLNYYKNSELPNALNLNVGDDSFIIPTTGYVDDALSPLDTRVTENTDVITNLLSRTYATKGAYNSLIQDCDEFIYPDSAGAMYRVFMQSLAKKGSRNVIDYCYEISFNDGSDSILVWLNVSEYKFDFGTSVTSRETYEAKDRDGNLVCYFYEIYRSASNGAWGIYFIAPDKNHSAGGSSEILGNRIAQIEAYEPKTTYRVSGYVAEDYGLGDIEYNVADMQNAIGDLTSLTTTDKTSLVNAINEVYEKSGEPFRVKQWAGTMDVAIEPCTTDKTNSQLAKMIFSIDATEGADYQIVGMIAYEVFDAASGGNRLNVWPVCQFTGQGQKELSVRWVCAGTTTKTAKRINAWVLLKHR